MSVHNSHLMSVRRGGAALQLLVVVAAAAVAVWWLQRLGGWPPVAVDWADPAGWVQRRPPVDVAAAVLRLAGLAAGWWLLVSTALYVAARAARLPRAVAATEWVTLPPVRRLADRAAAASLVGSTLLAPTAAPVVAAEPDEPPTPAAADRSDTTDPLAPVLPPPSVEPADPDPEVEREGDSGEDAAASRAADASSPQEAEGGDDGGAASESARAPAGEGYRVEPGDHLWGIAEQTLARAWGRAPSEGETAGYWRRLVEANEGRLASGDPDLIYPGEQLVLPALTDSEQGKG